MAQNYRKEDTAVYLCAVCQTAIRALIPKGLTGDFVHMMCQRAYEQLKRKTQMRAVSGHTRTGRV